MKRTVEVLQAVVVTVDETKFTLEFMEEFRASFFEFEDIDEHVEHLAQLYARGLIDGYPDEFVEGYGLLGDFGITFSIESAELYTLPY